MFEVGLELLALLILAGFCAGFVDAIAGGGGLITVPVLLLSGASPIEALSTNKVQGVFGAGTAALSYARAGQVNLHEQIGPAALSFVASFCGALLVAYIPVDWIKIVLPFLMVAIALFFALKPGLDDVDRVRRMSIPVFTVVMIPLIAAYDGLLGPGTGSFFMIAFVTLAGYGVLKATAHTKLLNFASNLGAIVAFSAVATPWWFTGLAMGAAQIAGAQVGSKLAVKVGARVIKPLLVVTSAALAARLIWDWF
ncbi:MULTISPECIES: TSUP family transporter [Halocynthiibacter]|uniref:Probable membrane transporter protein n=1 Tax=Halocynthiibacter halioticoli TaxID=2986804 RepID=A0AAE3IW18_9RHOB|nr:MULTISPECIES: TSUP family transporter [Halocynthiibacter]MCV6823029.1 TSUP family transporter [Halocynthiibacter halioticoli]MCW4056030.1 TSUP family transporter [Halocynthiibacter sp. SDUM655004]MDE0591400.1 TSUP family transporter [Halocynthiibacter sp. C4]